MSLVWSGDGRERTDFDAEAFFVFGRRAGAGASPCAGAGPFVGGGGYLGYVGFARHGDGLGHCGDGDTCVVK